MANNNTTTLALYGQLIVTTDDSGRLMLLQFLPDDEYAPVLERGSLTRGQLQMLRNGSFDYVADAGNVLTPNNK